MFDSIDVRTLGTGNYYITNGLNMPPNFPHGYLTVQRLDDYWAFLIFQQPYGSDYQNYILKQTNGIWRNWVRVITEQDLIQTSFNLIYNGNGINQDFEFDMPVGLSKIISYDITMVSNTWEFKLYHISSFVNVNRIHFDFSADVNQVYAVRVTFGK